MLPKKETVLVIDDDKHILRMLQLILEVEGFKVHTASDGKAALELFGNSFPELVLLDVRLPDMDGYTVCTKIRSFSQVPIIMVTAKGETADKAQGLGCGADDYITKPFSVQELAARIKAVLRRTKSWQETKEPAFHSGGLMIDFIRHSVTLNGRELNLSATEYRLLFYLVRNAGQIVSPDQLLEAVWGEKHICDYHLLHVNVARLRKKLHDNQAAPKYIVTKAGMGYKFLPGKTTGVAQNVRRVVRAG